MLPLTFSAQFNYSIESKNLNPGPEKRRGIPIFSIGTSKTTPLDALWPVLFGGPASRNNRPLPLLGSMRAVPPLTNFCVLVLGTVDFLVFREAYWRISLGEIFNQFY